MSIRRNTTLALIIALSSLPFTVGLHGEITPTGSTSPDSGQSFWQNGGDGSSYLALGYLYSDGSLTIDSATENYVLSNGHADIGAQRNGTATVTGALAQWNVNGELNLGRNNGVNGSLQILDGAKVYSNAGSVGYYTGATGDALVSGEGSLWSNSGDFFVGRAGSGTLTISEGGAVTNTNATLGSSSFSPRSQGTLTVTGAGSSWTSNGTVRVGDSGDGVLKILDGASATTQGNNSTMIAAGYNSTGAVTVSGADSLWTTNSLVVASGMNSTGTLDVLAGGQVKSTYGSVGAQSGANGTVTIDGAGSAWEVTGSLSVGQSGNGWLNVTNGGSLSTNGDLSIGSQYSSSTALLTLDGGTVTSGGSFYADSSRVVGNGSVEAKGLFGRGYAATANTSKLVFDGSNVASFSKVVEDQEIAFQITGDGIGSYGALGLEVINGAEVGFVYVYTNYSNTDSITDKVAGAGSVLNASSLYVGYQTGSTVTSTLDILDGGVVNASSATIGYSSFTNSTGIVNVDGAGSALNAGYSLVVGETGMGILNIRNGGAVSVEGSTIINMMSANSSINLDNGTLSTQHLRANLSQLNGNGTITATGLQGSGYGQLNFNTAGSNQATYTKTAGADVLNVIIKADGTGTLMNSATISNGAQVTFRDVNIGNNNNSGTTLSVSGQGSSLTSTNNFILGDNMIASMEVTGGAQVQTQYTYIGYFTPTGAANVLLSGEGSVWTSMNDMSIGSFYNNNTFTVADGALLQAETNLYISRYQGSDNFLRLDEGFVALKGDQLDTVASLLSAGKIVVWNPETEAWESALDSDYVSYAYYESELDAFDLTGYNGLGGYTIIAGLSMVPEPEQYAAMLGLAGLAFAAYRRRSNASR
ncbi:MAG: hypothetical protein Q7P63_05840 [Verrucomicrobiota bacterium JB022]|nr:hypothetical protein [Verrucomicrobiota bacterium JB022]